MENQTLKNLNMILLVSEIYKWTFFLDLWRYSYIDYLTYAEMMYLIIFVQPVVFGFLGLYLRRHKDEVTDGIRIGIKVCECISIIIGTVIFYQLTVMF